MNWTDSYIETSDMAVAPRNMRGAMADLQRNLLIKAFNINKSNNKVSGVVRGVEILSGEWDGKVYKLKGRALLKNMKLK